MLVVSCVPQNYLVSQKNNSFSQTIMQCAAAFSPGWRFWAFWGIFLD
jgi:hypothetical protein